MAKGQTVLFVLPSEVLVWQVAATYYQFFKGHVTLCTDLINFQNGDGDNKASVYIGTPVALETALTKARGCAGEEMVTGEREFMVLDGGYVVKASERRKREARFWDENDVNTNLLKADS